VPPKVKDKKDGFNKFKTKLSIEDARKTKARAQLKEKDEKSKQESKKAAAKRKLTKSK
jgi:hypothetical protein